MESLLYFVLVIFSAAILAMVLMKIIIGTDKRQAQMLYSCFVVTSIFLCLSDMLWGIMEYGDFWKYSSSISLAVNSLYHMLAVVVCYLWFLYSESEQDSAIVRNAKGILISIIPFILTIVLTATTGATGYICYIDQFGEYQRGEFYPVLVIVGYMYVAVAAIRAFINMKKRENFLYREKYRSLTLFCIFPTVAGILQYFFVGSPMISIGITFAVIQYYISSREQLISMDPLTRLNNRGQLIRYLDGKMKSRSKDKDLYLFIMDLDYFKTINDRFGHVEGDEAIIIVADTLKYIAQENNFFVCRYGGDEFVAVGEVNSSFKPAEFCNAINIRLEKETAMRGKAYELQLTVGYTKYSSDMTDISTFIREADKYLYKLKNSRKKSEI